MLEQLRADIERMIGHSMLTPKDFDDLRQRIYSRVRLMISPSTLRRVWGYAGQTSTPYPSTVETLARFLGYRSLEDYRQHGSATGKQSDPVLSRRLSVQKSVRQGDLLCLSWLPDRVCEAISLGGLKFRVVRSENTRLCPGDTFECSLIVEGEPLYLDNLIQSNRAPIAYVCGKKQGVRFELFPAP